MSWIETILPTIVNDMSLEEARDRCDQYNDPDVRDMKALELVSANKCGSVLVGIDPEPRVTGQVAVAYPFTLRDVETDVVYELTLHVDLQVGHAWVCNGHSRCSSLYNIVLTPATLRDTYR